MQITRILRTFGLPLLAKELLEQAARKRTYIVRVAYAVLLSAASFLFFYSVLQAATISPFAALGHGRDMYMVLVYLQFAGVYLFMPAMTCGVITQEKERSSLQLLFLTRLGPWAILFEKLLGRMVPMLGFLLLSLPLLALSYSLGGISAGTLWTGVWLLVLAIIEMGTLALACSAFFRTTVGAFIASYAMAFILFFGPWTLWMMLYLIGYLLGVPVDQAWVFRSPSPSLIFVGGFPFFGPPIAMLMGSFGGGLGSWPILAHSALVLSISGVFLVVARYSLVTRAFLSSENVLLNFLKLFDRKKRTALPQPPALSVTPQAASLSRETSRSPQASEDWLLPGTQPVAWRETSKRALGRSKYLIRLVVLIETPVLMLCGLMLLSSHGIVRGIVGLLLFAVWCLSMLVVSVRAAGLIAGERSHQTLDVLCTTPLSGREILLQKFQGVRRLILVMCLPLATLVLFNALWEAAYRGSRAQYYFENPHFDPLSYIVCSALCMGVYLPLIAWVSFAIGLAVRSQARAIIGSMGVLVAWCAMPLVFIFLPLSILANKVGGAEPGLVVQYTSLLSPAAIAVMNATSSLHEYTGGPWLPMAVNFTGYAVALFLVRALCLQHADRWLGRSEGQGAADPPPGRLENLANRESPASAARTPAS